MKATIRTGLLFSAAAVALAVSLPACGTQGNEPVGSSSADWTKATPSVNPIARHVLPPSFQISDCNLAEYVGILTAFNTAQLDASQLALSVSTNVDVKAFAQQMLTDEKNLATQLSTFMTQASLTPVDSEISIDIGLASTALLTQLRGDANFDRDFVVGEIGAHWMMNGFFSTMAFTQDFASSGTGTGSAPGSGNIENRNNPEHQFLAIVQSASQAVEVHLGLAFQVESKLVGMCGVAPAVVTPDAGTTSDCGCDTDDAGSCSHAR
jgi:predicted outer membrane protein